MSTPSNPQETTPSELFSPFLPTTYNIPKEEDRLNTFLLDNFSQMSDVINDKKIGIMIQAAENFSGGKWWYKTTQKTRNEYQTIAYIPSFPNSGVLILTINTTPQFPIKDINPEFVVTQVWGSASKPPTDPDNTTAGTGDYFSFYSQGDARISFTMSNKQIVITTTVDLTAYSGFIVITYIREGV